MVDSAGICACGGTFPVKSLGRKRLLCDECRRKKKHVVGRLVFGNCACGGVFPTAANRIYCDECRIERKRSKGRAWRKANLDKERAATRAWRVANPEKYKATSAAWALNNRERKRTRRLAWTKVNAERVREKNAAWRRANRERNRITNAAWCLANPEKVRANKAAWRAANPEKDGTYTRRLRRWGIRPELTGADWQEILIRHGGLCTYCGIGGKMTKDHAIPISRGGTDNARNIVPACGPCNSTKRNKTPEEFAIWKGVKN